MNDTIIPSARQRTRAKPRSAGWGIILFCTPWQWLVAAMSGLIVSGLVWPLYGHITYWIGATVFLMVVTINHMIFTSSFFIPLPHIAILIAGLQYVLAAWLSFYYPSGDLIENIGAQLPEYLAFAGYVVIAIALGWIAALGGIKRGGLIRRIPASPALLAELDVLFWFGLLTGVMSRFVQLGSLEFVLVLCGNLRYVGALGRMMVGGPGWKWRIWLTLTLEVLLATKEGMFHSLLLWSACTFALYIFETKPKRVVVFGLVCLGVLLLPALEQAKFKIREQIRTDQGGQGSIFSAENFQNTFDWFAYLGDGVVKTATWRWDADFLSDIGVRYNQGWIIHRVMETVPAIEPYARGKTLIAAAEAAALPRFLAPNKQQAGGKANMERYANYKLNEETSMNLGFAGELYANFGYWGGIIGCFCYALVLGLLFRWVFNRAALNPLWWAFVPYVGLIGLKAEDDIGEVLNWISKAAIITVAIYYVFPAIRAALLRSTAERQPARAGKSRFRRPRPNLAQADSATRDLGNSEPPE